MLETFFRPPSMSLDLSLLLHQFRQAGLSGTVPLSRTLPLDATWDALSSFVSSFDPFLVTLFVACDRAMVNVFVLSSGLSNLWELSGYFANKVFGLSSIACLCRPSGRSVWV